MHLSYGLNELGRVAVRCAAGRYHVQAENCIVEIVDEQGQPCAAGESGRLLVTSLLNFATPLLRYDTGDVGIAVAGPCPCGRTLPSFAEVSGRLRRFAGLPPGSRQRFNVLAGAVEQMPRELMRGLRQYQVHQNVDESFELRVRLEAPLPGGFIERVQAAWAGLSLEPRRALTVVEVARIPASPSGKLLDFSSDLYEDAYAHSATRR